MLPSAGCNPSVRRLQLHTYSAPHGIRPWSPPKAHERRHLSSRIGEFHTFEPCSTAVVISPGFGWLVRYQFVSLSPHSDRPHLLLLLLLLLSLFSLPQPLGPLSSYLRITRPEPRERANGGGGGGGGGTTFPQTGGRRKEKLK